MASSDIETPTAEQFKKVVRFLGQMGGLAAWEGMTEEERSEELRRRAEVGWVTRKAAAQREE